MTPLTRARLARALLAGSALAALSDGGAAAQTAKPGEVQEVVVTARRVTERLQDVPLSVAAIGQAEIAKRQIQNLNDIADTVPNLSIAGSTIPGGAAIVIRGIASNVLPDVSLDSSVGHYVDGVYIARLTAGSSNLADLARVEVVRGPQGTLFGRNVTQGAVNFITPDPSGELHAEIEGTVGNYDRRRVRAMVELPAWNGLAIRAAYVHDERDGDVKNPLGGGVVTWAAPFGARKVLKSWRSEDDNAYFLALRYIGVDHLTLSYKFDRADATDAPPAEQIVGVASGSSGAGYANMITTYHLPVSTTALKSQGSAIGTATSVHNYGHNLTAEYELSPAVTLKSITAYRGVRTRSASDVSGGPLLFSPGVYLLTLGGPALTKETQFSQELQVLAHTKRFDFTGGLYGFTEHGGLQYNVITGGFYGALGGKPVSTTAVNTISLIDRAIATYQNATNKSYAAYGHADIHLTDKFDLSGGLRYTKDHRVNVADAFSVIKLSQGQNPLTTGVRGTYRNDKVNYDITGTYELAPDVKAYVRYATGYLSGGYRGTVPFKPETTKAVEAGLKSEWLDRRLRVNADAFHIDTKNFQVTQFTFTDGVTVINVGGYKSNGVEWESSFVPFAGLNLQWDWGYNRTKYTDGRRAVAPRFNTNVSGEYDLPSFSNGSHVSLRVDANYRSKYYGVACPLTEPSAQCLVVGGGGLQGDLPAAFMASQGYAGGSAGTLAYLSNLDKAATLGDYWVVNLRGSLIDIPTGAGRAKASVWVKNVFNERGGQALANFGSFLGAIFEPARTIGVDLTWTY